MSKEKTAAILAIGDPLEFWVKQAHKKISDLNLPADFILEARAIVEGAFTRKWLDYKFRRTYPNDTFLPRTSHPIVSNFKTAGDSQIVEVMELAIYLKAFLKDPNLACVIDVMKNSFFTGLLQLAFAYRFKRAGATNLLLEPNTDRGKSDIYFEYEGKPFLVECYQPRFKSDEINSSFYLKKAISVISKSIDKIKKPLRVCIKLKKSITKAEANFCGHFAADVVKKINGGEFVQDENEIAKVEIYDISDLKEDKDFPERGEDFEFFGGADWGIKLLSVAAKDIDKIRLDHYEHKGVVSRIFVWRPEAEKSTFDPDIYTSELKEKLNNKIKQTKRRQDSPARIVIAECGIGGNNDDESRAIAKNIQHALIPKYEKIACIFLTDRRWLTNKRHRYDSNILLGRAGDALPAGLCDKLGEDEFYKDVLDEYKC